MRHARCGKFEVLLAFYLKSSYNFKPGIVKVQSGSSSSNSGCCTLFFNFVDASRALVKCVQQRNCKQHRPTSPTRMCVRACVSGHAREVEVAGIDQDALKRYLECTCNGSV